MKALREEEDSCRSKLKVESESPVIKVNSKTVKKSKKSRSNFSDSFKFQSHLEQSTLENSLPNFIEPSYNPFSKKNSPKLPKWMIDTDILSIIIWFKMS